MASVTTPVGADVRNRTGWNTLVRGDANNTALDAWLDATIIPDAEMETALAVGESTFDSSSLTARVVLALEKAICYRAAAAALVSPELARATGTHRPLLVEDSEEIRELRDSLMAKAQELESLAIAGRESSDAKPFALPAVSSSTFAVSSTDRKPTEKIDLIDERDDISADDTDIG